MKLGTVFLINAIVALVLGLGYFFAPEQLASFQGISLNAGGVLSARGVGALLLGYALVSWFVRSLSARDAIRAIVPGFFGGYLLNLIASLWAQLSGVPNALGWSNVVVTFLFTLAYGYFLFIRRQ
jgi:hypothetical protein